MTAEHVTTRPIRSPADLRAATGADFTVSDEQWAAISAPLEPTVVIAGAGSGKTELMAARVVYLVANDLVRPDQVLGLTFTTKATSELAARIRSQLTKAGLDRAELSDDGIPERLEPTISTYNAYAAGLLADHGLRIGFESDLRVMADASRFQLASRVIEEHQGVVGSLSDHPATVVGYLLALEGAMSEHLLSVEQVRAFHAAERPHFEATVFRLVAEGGRTKGQQDKLNAVVAKMIERDELLGLVEDYRVLKRELGLIDFSDQVAGACRLAEQQPQVGVAQREEFRVVLLDEYQDTSVAQARMLAGLFSGPDEQSGRGHAVMAVGDPNQAIYGWRGASVANIEHFRDQFPRRDGTSGQVLHLTVNRRSDRAILELANELAHPLLDRPGALVEPLVAKPDAGPGQVRTAYHRTADDELGWLAAEVRHAHDQDGVAWKEIGVLVRTNKHGAEAYDALTEAQVPVEIVGLGGLIRLPEVAQVVATLSLLDDLTDNASLLTILSGPRWQIGPRDLALLGRRSQQIAGEERGRTGESSLGEEVAAAVSGADPTEIPSLNEALEDPGDLAYSAEARDRFGALADELRYLRGFVGEPLLDLLRRIMDVIGLDTELASSVSAAARARRENLDLFVKAVAEFQSVDGSVTLAALNAWLDTEDEYGGGLDLAPPSESDTVKLLTIHRAKGLEFDVVHLIGVAAEKFPNTTLRPQWTTSASVLPIPLRGDADSLPRLHGYEAGNLVAQFSSGQESLEEQARRHQAEEELRLGYVAFTRARHRFVISSYRWTTTKKPIEPSPYLLAALDFQRRLGEGPLTWYDPVPEETNPVTEEARTYPWPASRSSEERLAREAAAQLVLDAAHDRADPMVGLSPEERERLEELDLEIARLLEEARSERSGVIEVRMPSSLSATGLARLQADRDGFIADLARPMPRPPAPAARFGTRFHEWLEERFGQQDLIDYDDVPGRADSGIDSDDELRDLIARFEAGQFADRAPYAVEAPFSLVLDGQVVRGRIDAVYREEDGSFLVVDWKTNRTQSADPLQLAIYREAWAELHGVDPEQVRAGFYYVRTDDLVVPDDLPDRDRLIALLPGSSAQG